MKKIKVLTSTIAAAALAVMQGSAVFADEDGGSISNTKLVTGTQAMIKDLTESALLIAPILGVLLIIYFLIRKSAADEIDQKKWKNAISIVVVCVIGVVVVSAVLNSILSYYK